MRTRRTGSCGLAWRTAGTGVQGEPGKRVEGISAGAGQHVDSLSERLKAKSSGTELICCSYADAMVAYWRDRVLLAQFETTSPRQRSGQEPDIVEEPMRRVGPTAAPPPRPPGPQMPLEAR
ncbi:DUF6461 domain-containing protein [Streptomyces rimosus]|uniref:DUF6461 domain-containing protein n=1 Tax=Streptomyces rimosus TaxID=1927 RepID=UPI0037D63787